MFFCLLYTTVIQNLLLRVNAGLVTTGFSNNEQYVIYSGTTALAYNGNNLTTASVTVENNTTVRSESDNIVWTVTTSGQGFRISYRNGNQTRYLRGDGANLRTTDNQNDTGTVWYYNAYSDVLYTQYNQPGPGPGGGGQRTRYLRLNNGSFTVTDNQNQASTIYIAQVTAEPVSGDLTFYYYNANVSASIAASEVAESLPNTWTDVATLAKEIPGYKYIEARANSTTGDVIRQVNGRAYRTGEETSGNGHSLSDIYFIYMRDYIPGEDVIPGLNGPITEKKVTHNDDGTFTIRLDITGVTNKVKHGANVVVVFDRTSSMSGNMSSSDRTMRINAAISAVNTMVNTLNPGSGADQNDIDFALVEFDRTAAVYDFGANGISGHTDWTKSGSALTTRVGRYQNGTNLAPSGATAGGGGTNWQAALQATAAVLENKPDADPTYVIFMTDGEPTIYIGSNTVRNNRSTTDPEYYMSVPYASAIVAADYNMYDIFCSASDTTLLESLYTTSGAASYVEADTTTKIEEAFRAVAQAMLDDIGSSNVATDDGVPELGHFDLNTVDGVAQLSDARYYKNGAAWSDAPVATPSDDGVLWNLSGVGTLEDGVVYSVEFEIWPSQAAYDLIADLNNGLRSYDEDGENPISAAERAQIDKVDDTHYTMKTNTSLKTSYKLYGETHSDDVDFTADAMDLPTETISVKKIWPQNMLDSYGAAAYRDPETGETKYATEIKLTLEREENKYLDIVVSKDGPDGDPATTDDNWSMDKIYVSCGFMTVENGEVHIKEPGHDYQIIEPPEFLYYWDLISDIYHPMVINGEDTVLVYDPDLSEADPENGIYEIPEDSGRFYKTQADTSGNTLEASNYRRSNLNLTKVIPEGADPDSLFEFTVTVTDAYSTDGLVWFSAWDNTAGALVTDTWVTGTDVVAAKDNDGNLTGYFNAPNGTELTMTIKAGWNVRFLNIYHGSKFSIEETGMPDVYEFDKLEAATQYDIMLESNKDWYDIEVDEETEAQTGVITGTITEPNNNYNITYTNKFKPQFYVYHSSDNTIERIQMEDARVENGKFDIAAETKSGYIYGGYYKAYGDTTATNGEIISATYSDGTVSYEYANSHTGGSWAADSKGTPYTGKKATAWKSANAYTAKGTEMTPVAGTVYYLKEVPDSYFRPYIQIVYDTYHKNAEGEYDNPLVGLYLITATDDANYTDAGISYDNTEKTAGKLSATLKITDSTGKATTLTAKSVFDGKQYDDKNAAVPRGYLTSIDNSSAIASTSQFTMRPYLKTLDGVKVYGVTERTVKTGDKTFVDDGSGVGKEPGITVVDATSIKAYE